MEEKLWRIADWMERKPAPPKSIELITTNRCNERCLTCWMRGTTMEALRATYRHEMSDDRLRRLIDEAAEMGVYEFAFVGGGDPMARKVTFELMQRIRRHGMHGDLVTNGTLFKPGQIEELVRLQWDRIKFSVDGATPETYDYLRGLKNGFSILKSNMLKLKALKREYGARYPKTTFNVVVSNTNYREFLDIIELAHEVGGEEILLLPMTVFSDTGAQLKLDSLETEEFQKQILEGMKRIKRYGIYSNMHEFLDARLIQNTNEMDQVMLEEAKTVEERAAGENRALSGEESEQIRNQGQFMRAFGDRKENFRHLPCYMPWHHITVIANGNIAPCFNGYVWETRTSLKEHSLAELWYGPYFDGFRRQLETRRLWDTCATCCVWRVFENREIRGEMQERFSPRSPEEQAMDSHFQEEMGQHRRISAIMHSLVEKAREVVPLAAVKRGGKRDG